MVPYKSLSVMKAIKSWFDLMQVVPFVIVFVTLVLHFQEDVEYGGYVMCFGRYQVPLMAPYSASGTAP